MSGEVDCFVYLIAKRDGARLVSPVKVGITANLASRLATLQTAAPFALAVVHSLRVPARWMAREIEDCFHHTQRKRRLYGEWFDLSPVEALRILAMQFALHLDMNEVSDDLKGQVLEMSGAGEAAHRIVRDLLNQEEGASK